MKKKIFYTIAVLLLVLTLILWKSMNQQLMRGEDSIDDEVDTSEKMNSIVSYVQSEYSVCHENDIHFDENHVSICGFIKSCKKLVMMDRTGLIFYDLKSKDLNRTSIQLSELQVVGKDIYGIDDNHRLMRLDLETLELNEVVGEKVYSYVVTPEGISYQIFRDGKVFLVMNNQQMYLSNIGMNRSMDFIIEPYPVNWAPNGKYALFFEEYSEEDDGTIPKLYLADLNDNSIKLVDSTLNLVTKWSEDSSYFLTGKIRESADVYDRKTLTRLNSFQGAFDEYLLLDHYLYGVNIVRDGNKVRHVLKKYDIKTGEERLVFDKDSGSILDFCRINGRNLYAFRDYSNSSVYIINEDGQVIAKFGSPENHKILSWGIDENGYVALGFRVKDKYLIRIFRMKFD